MPDEWLFLRRLLGDTGQGWLQATMLGFLFLVLAFKPDRIHNRALFRVACLLFALSLLIAPILNFALTLLADSPGPSSRGFPGLMGGSRVTYMLITTIGPILFGISVMCALVSLIPGRRYQGPAEPARHPLE